MGTGYACPVCEIPQRDAKHLADHLAFTAMLRHEDHEAWLDEHVPGWGSESPDSLGARVVEFAAETEYEEVFEDTVARSGPGRGDLLDDHGHTHDHDHGHPPDRGHGHPGAGSAGVAGMDAEAQAILTEARELTREMLADEGADDGETDDGEEIRDGTDGDREARDGTDGDREARDGTDGDR
ncbi:MAG: DUF5810 domain-containing protein, partial [Salinigranum sp.]